MGFNGSGTFIRVHSWQADQAAGTKIRADRMDAEDDGFATGLSNCLTRDGQSAPTAATPWGGQRLTSLGAATADGDALNRLTADGRYVRNPNALTAESAIDDADLLAFWDTSAASNRQLTLAQLISKFRGAGNMMPVGTRCLFQQTTPPTGWTKETGAAYENAALRMTTGAVATGGSATFTATFASRTPAGTVGSTTLTLNQIPAHTHQISGLTTEITPAGSGNTFTVPSGAGDSGSAGGGQSHTHSLTMTAMDFAVKYADACVGVKA